MRYRLLTRTFLVATTAVIAVAAAAVAHAQLFGASEREINRQARVQWMTMKRQLPVTLEPHLQSYVECVTNRVLATLGSGYDHLAWEVVVFEDDMVNAFAIPGGKIGVFTGLLRVADNQDMLAAVIGHEIAHVTKDHVIRRARRAARTDALVILGSAATGVHPDLVRTGATIGVTLPYERDQESEADVVGLEYMAKAGFDPRASIELWRAMAVERRERRQAEFLSSHPSDDRRMDTLVRSLTPALIHFNDALDTVGRANCRL
jgi:predicted Zn-dependent protease